MPVAISSLLDATRADRKLRAYAYLTASFRDRRSVNDALDCLIPFVVAALREQSGQILSLDALAANVASLGLKIPVYVLEQLVGRLVERGHVTWDKLSRKHFVVPIEASTDDEKVSNEQIEFAFDQIEPRLQAFAAKHGINEPPLSSSWPDALITFLKSEQASEVLKSAKLKGTLIGNTPQLESFVVALFIQNCETHDSDLFANLVTIFTGILIEDFIENIQTIAAPDSFSKLSVYYDTTVLLRLLGTSGRLLQSATMDMHRTLQDLGCRSYYFDFVELETSKILETLLTAHSLGQNLYNETAEAIYSGEISISDVREVSATLTVRLGALNIFPFVYNFASRRFEDAFQIDESRFAEALMSAAQIRDRNYKRQNAETDARSTALIIRMKKGIAKREVSAAGHLFVSRNSLLQRVARDFSIKNIDDYNALSTPPVLTVGQITTIAWLSSTRELEPHRVSKELLASCYSAVRPSVGWADEFAKALITYQNENPKFAEEKANQHFFLQTARAMARDVSLGQPAVLRKVNLADIFTEAAQAATAHEADQKKRIEELEARIIELEKAGRID